MFEIFEGLTAWNIILTILACWLILTLFSCMQKVKQEDEKAYLTFGTGFFIFGGLCGWLAYHPGSLYFLFWGCGGGTILTLLFIRTASMREFRRLFLQNFAGTFWGCWLPSRYKYSRRCSYNYSDENQIDYSWEEWQRELAERHNEGMRIHGTTGDSDQSRNEQGLPVDSYGDPDWDTIEKENESYDDLERPCESAYD